jgi:23S rRNA (guanosine2251-2'-O)-methyltransferase
VAERRSAPVTTVVHKASAGATAYLPVARVTNLVRAMEELKAAGFWVAGASEHATQALWDAPLDGRLVVALGAEGEGLSRLVAEHCDFLVSIPVNGRVSSLNVAQAATVLAYEWVRRAQVG